MLESLEDVRWRDYPQPSGDPSAVPSALRALALASTREDADNAYGAVLNAVGRDHAGTYYPVVIPAIHFLGDIAAQGGEYARRYALEALTDLVWSFEPEPGFEMISDARGKEVDLRTVVRDAGAMLSPLLQQAAVRPDNEPLTARLARDLLELLGK